MLLIQHSMTSGPTISNPRRHPYRVRPRGLVVGHGVSVPIVLAFTGAMLALLLGLSLWAIGGYCFFFYALARTLLAPNEPLPIRWLILLIASVQWVIAPQLAYAGAYEHFKYYMYVTQDVYMPIAVSGLLALAVGLFAFRNRAEQSDQLQALSYLPRIVRKAPMVPLILVGISLVCSVSRPFLPDQLAFPAYLAINLKYSAAILIMLSDRRDRSWWVIAILGVAVVEAAATSLFHDVFLWSVIIGSFYAFVKRVPLKTRVFGVLIALLLGLAVQSVKPTYRYEYWGGNTEAGGSSLAYIDLTIERVNAMLTGEVTVSEASAGIIMRLNQGWIISRVVQYIPNQQPYAGGESITGALKAALLPRFLAPDKAIAGGRDNFERFTGLPLSSGTSMGVSTLGEAYANFGPIWGSAFMALFGAFLAACIALLHRLMRQMPILICFLPNIFLHAFKAETDFNSVLNFLLKGGGFYIALCFALSAAFRLRRSDFFDARHQTQPTGAFG